MNGEANPAVVEMRGLSTRIGSHYVHRNLDLRVERGQIVGLVGGSGSGKTTLLRQILGLIQPAAGTVRLFGQDLGGAVKGFKDGMKDANAPDQSAETPPPEKVGGQTIDVEVKEKTKS